VKRHLNLYIDITLHYTPATLSKQRSTLLPQTATMSNDSIIKFRPLEVECCFDIVAVFGNNVAGFGNNVERNFVPSTKSKQIEHVQFVLTLSKGRNYIIIKSFDIVAVCGNKVECCFDKVERSFDIVAGVDGS